jgi:phosphoribosylglycinamide formyltransferase-1
LNPLQLAVFASGRGSNFLAILEAMDAGRLEAEVKVVISNNPKAGALDTARQRNIPAITINKKDFTHRDSFVQFLLDTLDKYGVNLVALAGYMKKIPPEIISRYKHRILNIHPALLPAFGGKGMYGRHVHEAVLAQGCRVSGVTVHLVDEAYDRGPIVTQRCVPVEEGDTPETLAARVLETEHRIYAETIQLFAEGRVQVVNGKARILDR